MKSLISMILFVLFLSTGFAQTKQSLKERIQEHYSAIHDQKSDEIWSHHLKDFSLFPWDGSALVEPGFLESIEKMGAELKFPKANVMMKHFNAQMYDNVGVATFYLDGNYGEDKGLFRVTAVWVWKNGEWKEAHHHESRLKN